MRDDLPICRAAFERVIFHPQHLFLVNRTGDHGKLFKRWAVQSNRQTMGTLIPDAIVHSGSILRGVVDAKYKSLHPSASSPNGPQRDDLYQMAAYLGRFAPPDGRMSWGVLAYPLDPARPSIPQAEQFSPWSLDGGRKVVFTSLPHVASDAAAKLRVLIGLIAPERDVWRLQA